MTWPQIYLMLDGARYNAPDFSDAGNSKTDGGSRSNKPPAPDMKADPVGYLRWQLTHESPLKLSSDTINSKCAEFQKKLDAGEIVIDA